MWTNVFRIGDLQVISWFQFLPSESDVLTLSENSEKKEYKDVSNYLVLSAHLQLQNEGFLSTWTNSFVGPWDPSQGVHNPDEKIKLWLFLPGRNSSLSELAQAAVSRLRVVGTGLWLSPGDSEEVAVALSQALRNSIERALKGLSYIRYGDVFARSDTCTQHEKNFRRMQPVFEFIFSASEEALYVHAVISAKHIRRLHSVDLERVLMYRSSNLISEGLPVIVSPTGMRGRLTGCQSSDFVNQVYIRGDKCSDMSAVGLPFNNSQSSACQLRGQSCYVEITIGCLPSSSCRILEPNSSEEENTFQLHKNDPNLTSLGRGQQEKGLFGLDTIHERTFIYPAETVLVPIMHRTFARPSLKRFGFQHLKRLSLFDLWALWNFPGSSHLDRSLAFASSYSAEFADGPGIDCNGLRSRRRYNSSSNSISSSINSTSSSTSSDSEYAAAVRGGDLEADADSYACRQAGQSSDYQTENDGQKVSKRLRSGETETSNQAGRVWNWNDDNRGVGIDIEILLSEFGDFGDFFENGELALGEPPGTAESHTLNFPSADCRDISSSPASGLHGSDQKCSPIGLSSMEYCNQSPSTVIDDSREKSNENAEDANTCSYSVVIHSSSQSSCKLDELTREESVMIFSSDYSAIDMPSNELCMAICRSPYLPKSKVVASSKPNVHVYSAVPPSSEATSDERPEVSARVMSCFAGKDTCSSVVSRNLYTSVLTISPGSEKRAVCKDISFCKEEVPSSLYGINSAINSSMSRRKNSILDVGGFLRNMRVVFATEVDCIMFQAAICRLRHTLLSLSNRSVGGWNKQIGSPISDLIPSGTSNMTEMTVSKLDNRKKDFIPARLAGHVDIGMLDGTATAAVGVWRSVGVPKGMKPLSSKNPEIAPLPLKRTRDEGSLGYGQRQPFQNLLDALPLLVQQSASFVDITLDTVDGEGPFCWLALQEQQRREFACGPSMVHSRCGGLLSACHSLDIAGVDLIDPLSADVQASSVISLLQSDIKLAMKSSFRNVDGPLSVIDWCRGSSLLGDPVLIGDGYSFSHSGGEIKDTSNSVSVLEPISPSQATGCSSSIREGSRMDDTSQRRSSQEMCMPESEQHKCYSRCRPTLSVLPLPAILVGYQDDWLKASTNCVQFWEKAPLEPYALVKPVTYYALCPAIDLLTSAASNFFQQLGTVYEACKLGTHSPHSNGSQMELSSGKCLSSGIILIDCPQKVKIASTNAILTNSISDYFLSLSKEWNMNEFMKNLTKVLRDLRTATSAPNHKEGTTGPCMVVYVVCPFPEPVAILQTLIECSASLGSAVLLAEKERRSFLHSQVAKSQNFNIIADEVSSSNVITLSGFSIPRLVLQIINIEMLLKLNRPVKELAMLKDIAFTVYNKARRVPRPAPTIDMLQMSPLSGRSQSLMMHVASSIPGLWKDSIASRIPGQVLSREPELDAALRPPTWDNSWQASKSGGLSYEASRLSDAFFADDARYMYEPLFILAEPTSVDNRTSSAIINTIQMSESSNTRPVDDSNGIYTTAGGSTDVPMIDNSENEYKPASLHCCYGWTEEWRWLICIWTDSRGELLDTSIFPFGGISSRQDTKVLQCVFVQILYQAYQILLCASSDISTVKPRDIIITRLGSFFELEIQEWQKAIYSFGGTEVKKWSMQLRRSIPDVVSLNNSGASLQQQDVSLIQERSLPSSPNPSLYSPHTKTSSFMKGALGQSNSKKQILSGQTGMDGSRGLLQLMHSVTFVGVSIDHSLHFVLPADISSAGGGAQQNNGGSTGYWEAFSPLKSLGSLNAIYLFIPSPSMRHLPPTPLQLPTCLTSESPPLAHLLHSKGSAIPLCTGYVVSKKVPTMKREPPVDLSSSREDWPSVLSVSLIDHYGSGINNSMQEKAVRGAATTSINVAATKHGRSGGGPEIFTKDYDTEAHLVLEVVAAELQSLSWMTVSPLYLDRRTSLPFHCDILLRLRRILYYADKEFSHLPDFETVEVQTNI